MTQLNELINNLKEKPEVDALFVAGSQGAGEEKPYSDIDIVIIFKENSKKLSSLFEWIDGKPGDIYFFDHSDIERLSSLDEIPANKMDAVLLDWLLRNEIIFDKSGKLTVLKGKASDLIIKMRVPLSEAKSFENKINYGYIRNKRYFDSEDPQYHEALEINLLYDISNVLVGYFEFRNIPWRGEKFVIKYLKENDPSFYELYRNCIKEQDLSIKFELYSDLVKRSFYGQYKLWPKDAIVPFTNEPIDPIKETEFVEYWNNLKK